MYKNILFALILVTLIISPAFIYAHGAEIEYNANITYKITAKYDNGKPMAGAQVIIYAPDNPSTPWKKGVCDENGNFTFIPDTSKKGNWTIQVRKAGHGTSIYIPIDEKMATSGKTGYSSLQLILMIGCVVWGLVGTSLYFRR
ncbi:carboxypeptidase-like regulatory domain-containing protein [Thermohalobacter berrensis]|uniref:Carboxypeptidase regulatory-like domain-containing protein n=1 Tax=Thermohalobacter berrensis TaxID=99594 RepID=A0A419SU24_9FIRM|nr:carboxypeptidase-like regulatory domain-containing protein [Thermohalobacter berrensis]RKD28787.1 hypothetical protein BET03_07050 [Thermohalobacter berrensis]